MATEKKERKVVDAPDARFREGDVDITLDMRNHWYPIALSRDTNNKKVQATHILGDPIVIYRDKFGKAVVLADKCAHRSAPLSLGEIHDGILECKYHGWQYDATGAVTKIPALLPDRQIPGNANTYCYPSAEQDELVWVWPGDAARAAQQGPPSLKPGGKGVFGEEGTSGWGRGTLMLLDLDIDHSLMVENLLDPAHVDFTHDKTIGKRNKAGPMQFNMMDGGQDRIVGRLQKFPPSERESKNQFVFTAPCHIQLQFEFKDGWNFHQAIHCVPTTKGSMRMIYRECRTFFTWLYPLMSIFGMMERVSLKIILQDYELLRGQQNRLRQGAKEWHSPILIDQPPKLYRAWWSRAMRLRQAQGSGPHVVSKAPGPWFKGYANDIEDMVFSATHYGGASGFGADCSGCDLSDEPQAMYTFGNLRGRLPAPKVGGLFGVLSTYFTVGVITSSGTSILFTAVAAAAGAVVAHHFGVLPLPAALSGWW